MTDSVDSNALATTAKPANVKLSLGAQLALKNPEELLANIGDKLAALITLGSDTSLSAAVQQAIKDIAVLASPTRPGMEEMAVAWKVPRCNIAQPTTQSVAKPEVARNGDLYTTAGQILERPFGIIPVYFYEENINFPDQGKNPVCQSPDAKLGSPFGECAKCPHLPMGKQNGGRGEQNKTDCQNNIVCVALTMDLKQVVVIQFGKTSRKTGNALLSLAGQQQAVWKQSYTLETEKKTADVGIYFIYKVAPTGKDNAADVQRMALALYELFIAERHRMLADWYGRPARAPQTAIEAEGAFSGGALEAGLGDNEGVEPDLNAPPPASTPSARSTSKPM